MKSPELLEATASEPLSLDEEFEMQRMSPCVGSRMYQILILAIEKWHTDDDSTLPLHILRSS